MTPNLRAQLLAAEIAAMGPMPETAEDLEVAAELDAPPRVGEQEPAAVREAWCGKCDDATPTNADGCIACAERAS